MVEHVTESGTRRAALAEAIEREYAALRRGVEALIWKLGVAAGREAIAATAEDVLHEALARALRRAEDFDPARSAHAWLLGFAVNVLRERRRSAARAPRLVSLDAPRGNDPAAPSLAERLCDPDALAELRVAELLDLVGPADALVLRLAFVDGLRGRALGEALGIGEGAARVRQSRAVRRLAEAYRRAERGDAPGGDA
jgi:RNA polymerase sigma-70 factor (ECF subfamily)